MAKPLHAEHRLIQSMPLPTTVEVCRRCRRGLIVYKGVGTSYRRTEACPHPHCHVCDENEPGEVYVLEACPHPDCLP
jgi:hypothetical protein